MDIDIVLTGEGEIDNAYMCINDPEKENKIWLRPESSTEFKISGIDIQDHDSIEYYLKVKAYFGTIFECKITREDDKVIAIEGVTGGNNKSVETGTKTFSDE